MIRWLELQPRQSLEQGISKALCRRCLNGRHRLSSPYKSCVEPSCDEWANATPRRQCGNRAHEGHGVVLERARHGRLKQDVQHLMSQVHQNLVEVDTAVATISSTQTASSQTASQLVPQAAPLLVPQTAPSATAQPSQDPWAAAAAHSRMSDTIPQGGVPTPRRHAGTV